MRRVDDALRRLAERGSPVGAEMLLDGVEQRLELGTDSVVVAIDERTDSMQTQQQTESRQKRRGIWIAAVAFGVLIAIGVGAAMVLQATEEESLVAGQPPGPLEEFARALQANDVAGAQAVIASPDPASFVPWLVGLDTSSVEFTDCALGEQETVECSVDLGPNLFHSRITGENVTSTFSAQITGDQLQAPSLPPPAQLAQAEAAFEQWVQATHPDRYDEMFANPSLIIEHIRGGYASGAARTELADEYIASR